MKKPIRVEIRVGNGYRIVIPREIRKFYEINVGSKLLIEYEKNSNKLVLYREGD